MKTLTINNRSAWPDPFVKIVCGWIVQRIGITWAYRIDLPNARRWHGHGATRLQRSCVPRHFKRTPRSGLSSGQISRVRREPELWPAYQGFRKAFPWPHKDNRFKWAPEHILRDRVESFVYLIAHEAAHATDNQRRNLIAKDGKISTASMEFHCNRIAMETVEAFRVAWREDLRPRVVKALRKGRAKRVAKVVTRSDPTPKLDHAQAMLAKWQGKQKSATNKVRRWARTVKYYSGRVAAKNGA